MSTGAGWVGTGGVHGGCFIDDIFRNLVAVEMEARKGNRRMIGVICIDSKYSHDFYGAIFSTMNEPITKRLHVSGLTPALTPADLSARLSHFGTVKSLDGFGLPDGVGQPRKFGYVTLETTNGALKKCTFFIIFSITSLIYNRSFNFKRNDIQGS